MKQLDKSFFKRDTVKVSKELLGKLMEVNGHIGRIVETEAYKDDQASHARKMTGRSRLMYETYGHIYVYMIYGMYHCLNFTSDTKPGAVLIRAVEPLERIEEMMKRRDTDKITDLCSGPGKLCQALNIDNRFNGIEIGKDIKLYDDGFKPDIAKSSRIGISTATDLEWRFFIKDSMFLSRR